MAQNHQNKVSGASTSGDTLSAPKFSTLEIKFMLFSIIQFLNLVAFAFVASQPIFYMLALKQVQSDLKAPAYVELRNLIDHHLQVSLRIVYYSALATSILLVIISLGHVRSLLFITSLIALLALVADMYFMIKGNMPVNKAINSWSAENYPADWQNYRTKWFSAFKRRQVADFIGFGSLLVGAVFQ